MARINWSRLSKNIPTRIRIASKVFYEVLMIKDFHGEDTWGETRFDERQIVLKSNLTPKLMAETYIHELFHAWSHEHGVGLTEEQVLSLEKAIPYIIEAVKSLEGKNE